MSGTDSDSESTVATIQDLPNTERGDVSAATETSAESRLPAEAENSAPDTQDSDTQDSDSQRTGWPSPKTRRRLPIALAVLVIASAVSVGLLGSRAITVANTEQNATEALDAAVISTSQVLSYSSKTLDADLARARAQLSGPFAVQFEEMASNLIVPTAQQQDVSSKVEVIRSALIDARPDRAEVMLYLSQTASASSQPQPQQGIIQIKVTMTKAADGQWRISEMQPL
ncbi:MAG: hypothetical protein ACRDRH_13400 [Pseudonocardia sp.]